MRTAPHHSAVSRLRTLLARLFGRGQDATSAGGARGAGAAEPRVAAPHGVVAGHAKLDRDVGHMLPDREDALSAARKAAQEARQRQNPPVP